MNNSLSSDKIELFESLKVSRAVAKLAVPTVVGSLVMILYNLTDTFFVGMLDDPIETTAVTLIAPLILLFNAVNNLFGVGTGSMMSRALGQKDYESVKRTSSFGFYAALLSGLFFSIASLLFRDPILQLLGSGEADRQATVAYMKWTVLFGATPAILNVVLGNMVRSEGCALHATVGTVSGCLLNILLDPFFILPRYLGLGAEGAGLATCLANSAACLYFFAYMLLKRKSSFVNASPSYAIPGRRIVKEVFGVGIPAAIQNILNVSGMTILNNRMAFYGAEAVSAMGIAHKIAMLPMYVSMGIGQGIMPLVGYNYASGNKQRIRDTLFFTIKISGVLVLLIAGSFLAFPRAIMQTFMENKLVVDYGSAFLRGLSFASPFLAMDFLAVGVFQACGLGKYSFRFAIARKILLEIPAILLLDLLFPMYGIAYSQLIAESVLAVFAVILLRRIIRE